MQQFSFNLKWYLILKKSSDKIRHNVMDALMEYMVSGKAPELKTAEAIAFEFIKTEIEERALQSLPTPQPEPAEEASSASGEPQDLDGGYEREDSSNNDCGCVSETAEKHPDREDDYDHEKTYNLIRIVPALNTYFSGKDPDCCSSYYSDLLRLELELHKELAVKVMYERANKEKTPIREYVNHRILASDLYDRCEPVVKALRPDYQYEFSEPITRKEWMAYMNKLPEKSEDSGET